MMLDASHSPGGAFPLGPITSALQRSADWCADLRSRGLHPWASYNGSYWSRPWSRGQRTREEETRLQLQSCYKAQSICKKTRVRYIMMIGGIIKDQTGSLGITPHLPNFMTPCSSSSSFSCPPPPATASHHCQLPDSVALPEANRMASS
jgi:hypothetical protein